MEPTTPATTVQPTAKRSFAIGEAINTGWNITKPNFFSLLGILAIAALVNWGASILNGALAYAMPEDLGVLRGFLMFVVAIVFWFIGLEVQIGILNYTLKLVDGQKPIWKELFSYFDIMLVLKFFVGYLMYGLLVAVGFILLIIPGIIFLVRFSYFTYFIAEKHMGPVDALMNSWEITKGNTLLLIGFALVFFLINVVGALLLLVGLLVTIPLSMISAAYVYRKLNS